MKTIKNDLKEMSLAKAARISGFGLLIMILTVPFAEFYIFPKIISEDATLTFKNIVEHRTLFTVGVLFHFITLICDIIVAWSLYIFLKPINQNLSLLVAWFRLSYVAMYLVVLTNFIKILNLLDIGKQLEIPQQYQISAIAFYMNSFKLEWSFSLMLFGVYLIILGYLVFKAEYVPKIFGILLIIAGLGYLINTFCLFLFPNLDTSFLLITFFGEMIFMLWLLIKGTRIKKIQQ
jgi:Domain of unknown function (DUF4386)